MPADTNTSYKFPYPSLTTVEGKPTAATLLLPRKEIYANARSIHCDLGGGADGYLGIVIPAAQYTLRTLKVFTAPVHPGAMPVYASGTTGPVITANDRTNDSDTESHRGRRRCGGCRKTEGGRPTGAYQQQ
jgi:hypothetical protein